MPKYLLEDMVKIKRAKKEIKNIQKEISLVKTREVAETIGSRGKNPPNNHPKYMLWFVAFLSVLFFIFALSFLFSSAKITVNPKTEDIILNENFSASLNPVNGGLFFDSVVISGEEKSIIQATEEKEVAEKATGTVIIFNSFSSSAQRLDIDTRLEGSNGKLYKTQTKIIVPGINKDGTPGSSEVDIYAAEAGEEYNSGPLDFQIVGFKGTPKYDKFKVRTKTGTLIKGGFKGKAPIVSETEKSSAVVSLKDTLKTKLLQKAIDQIPSGFILFKDAIFLSANENNLSIIYNDDKSMTLVQSGTLYGILFNEQKLTKKIGESAVSKYDGSDIYIPSIKNLNFTLSNQNDLSFGDIKNINFNLSGSAKVVWKADIEKIANSLLGKHKKDFVEILSKYDNIDSANLKLNPPWKRTIPEKVENIKIIVNYPTQS